MAYLGSGPSLWGASGGPTILILHNVVFALTAWVNEMVGLNVIFLGSGS